MKQLTSRAHLPAYIQQLPATHLSRLIDEIGLEDSQEILASMGQDQMRAVLSVSLWSAPRPRQEEVLDLDQLIRWIDIWRSTSSFPGRKSMGRGSWRCSRFCGATSLTSCCGFSAAAAFIEAC